MEIDTDRLRDEVFAEQLLGILDTVADKPYPTVQRRNAARQAAAQTMVAYNPRDPVETSMAGHCVVYDNVLRDVARGLLRGQAEEEKAKAVPALLNCGRMFVATLKMLHRM